jgi:hypothetical protein
MMSIEFAREFIERNKCWCEYCKGKRQEAYKVISDNEKLIKR